MVDPRVCKLAELIVKYSTEMRPRDEVIIVSPIIARDLAREIYRQSLLVGAFPYVHFYDEVLEEIYYKYAKDEQLKHIPPHVEVIFEKATVHINILAVSNSRRLNNVNPEKIKIHSAARRGIMKKFMEREAKGEVRWVVLPYPTPSMAQEAGMSTVDFEDFVFKACHVDKDDPIAEWRRIHEQQKRYVKFLSKVDEITVLGPETDLTVSVKGRKWINADGKKNMPDGEIFTSPIEDSANGVIRFTFPILYRGFEIRNVKLRFKDGVVVEATASEGQQFLNKLLETDEGAKRLGEIAFGTNYEINVFTKEILFDEKMGGTIHLAIGRGFPEAGGKNFSTVHIDMIKDMKEGKVYADGELIYEKGKFLI
ncbi:MAG: aminopeptidase [Thermoprotei archaeon]|nr:MAG: aminopeptidase [Thermoprotei archaeon]